MTNAWIKERAWSVVLPDTCGFGNGPLNRPHRAIEGRGIKLSSMIKNPIVSFYLCFELFIENLFFKWIFFL